MATPALPRQPQQPPIVDLGRILLALVVISVGVLFLLEAAGTLDAGEAIGDWWPAVVIATGVFQYFEHSRPVVQPLLLVAAGALLLLGTTDALGSDSWDYVWPLAVIAGGVLILSRWSGLGHARANDEDTLIATGIFGGPEVASTSQNFRGGSLTAVFGGVTLDLRGARPAPEGAAITATCAFGGIDILVPRGWQIAMRTTPIFGGVSDKTDHSEPPAEGAPVLRIDALCVFGGLDVKHKKS
jgi:Cell wall-active antibiotics response 4TMS YvqF